MTSIEFIISELKSLHNKFTSSNIRYEFSKACNTHLIEVTPLEFYNSESYMEYELNLEDKFIENYPLEDLIFISDQSLNKITNPIFEIFCEKVGGFRTDFIVFPSFDFDSCQNVYEQMGENNYALAA